MDKWFPSYEQVMRDAEIYPMSDGKPLSEDMTHFHGITNIANKLMVRYAQEPDILVAANIFWYPLEGRPLTRTTPDVLVAFGRPQGDRGSYLQFREENIAPQVVFEVISHRDRTVRLRHRFDFYQRFGAEEYYICDPFKGVFSGWLRSRSSGELEPIAKMDGWVSPHLGLMFLSAGGENGVGLCEPLPNFVEARCRLVRMEAKLRELGIDPEMV